MRKSVFLLIVLFAAASCQERDLYEGLNPENRNDFGLFDKISMESSLPEGTRCLLFTSYPYTEEGDFIGEPVMVAYAPFKEEVRIPKSVDKLYTYANGEVKEFTRGNIQLTGSSPGTRTGASTRADKEVPGPTQVTLTDAFVTAINKFYPEGLVNVNQDDRGICTDLIAPKGIKEIIIEDGKTVNIEWDKTKVWLTYVTDGGSAITGDLWFYSYQVDANGIPTTTLAEVEASLTQVFNRAKSSESKGKRVYLGEFEPGSRIGFKYYGNATINSKPYPKYSTPFYNKQAYGYEVTCGVIRKWEYNGETYATLGMENRLPHEGGWDGDYNDLVCLVEADPLFVSNVIEPPTPDPSKITWNGYWLFEDNYPAEGDYDFNDLVVKYAITETQGKPTVINLQFLAKGATFNNGFGVNGKIYFENLTGYENVYASADKVEATTQQITLNAAKNYIPMMNNGAESFDLNTFNKYSLDFPNILDIPIANKSTFQWCLEQVRIDKAYPRYKDWVNSRCTTNTDWYKDTPVANSTWNK